MNHHPRQQRLQRTISSVLQEGRELIDEVLGRLSQQQWSGTDYFSVQMALEEAVVNAIKHGNREIAEKKVHLDCRYSPTHVCIEIQDEGPGFNPANVPDCTDETHIELPCGRGLLLMRSFMNRVEYKGCGNVVVMEKTRDTASASAH